MEGNNMTMSHFGRHGLTLIFVFFLSVILIGCGDQQETQKKTMVVFLLFQMSG